MAEILKMGGSSFHPSAANTGNEQPTVLRGKNMLLRGSNGSYYFECFGGIKNLNEPIPMIALTGTIAYTEGSLEIVGTGTDFKNELRFGQKFFAGDPNQVFVVEDTFDATHMTVQRAPDASASGEIGYKVPHLQEAHNQRATMIWGNVQKFDRGNYIAVGEGQVRLNGQPLQGEPLYATRRLKLAIYDPATGDFSVDGMGFTTTPTVAGVSIDVVVGGSKDMTQGFYSFMWSWADSRAGYGFSNPSDVIKLDSSNNPIEITATNQRFKLDFTAGLASKPIKADAIIVYRSLFSDPTQNVTQTGEGSWYVAKVIKIEDLEAGDLLYLDVLDGELGTEVSFDNDVPPEADWVSVLGGDAVLVSCYGDTVVGGGDRGSAPGPFVSPQRRGNRHGFPAELATVLSPPEQIIGYSPALGRLFLMTRVGLPFAASTGEPKFPIETRAFWTTRFKSPYGLVFYNDSFYAFTVTGATRAIGTADKAQEQIDFSDAVADITRNWFAGYVHAAYDPQNEMVVFVYSAAYRNDDGWWVSIALPFSLLHQCWMPIIEITKPDRDMVVTGVATVGSYLQFLAGGRGLVEEIPSSEEPSSEEPVSSEEEFEALVAPAFVCGGESAIDNNLTHYQASAGTGTTMDTDEPRTGTRSLHSLNSDATVLLRDVVSETVYTGRFYLRFKTLPNTSCYIVWSGSQDGHASPVGLVDCVLGVGYDTATGGLHCGSGAQAWTHILNFVGPGYPVVVDTWYRIDFKIDRTSGARSINAIVTVDGDASGTALTAATDTYATNAGTTGQVKTGADTEGFGPLLGEWYIDDMIVSFSALDYPIGPGRVTALTPNADGTHSITGANQFERGGSGTDITNATTDAFDLIDAIPMNEGDMAFVTTNYIACKAPVDPDDYVEVAFGIAPSNPTPTARPRMVSVLTGGHGVAGHNGRAKMMLNDNGTLMQVWNEDVRLDRLVRYNSVFLANPPSDPSGNWDIVGGGGNFLGLKARFYGVDNDNTVAWDGMVIEGEFAEDL